MQATTRWWLVFAWLAAVAALPPGTLAREAPAPAPLVRPEVVRPDGPRLPLSIKDSLVELRPLPRLLEHGIESGAVEREEPLVVE